MPKPKVARNGCGVTRRNFPYSIAAIPTVYNGRQYRSRLEARWSAFFDLLGFHSEYEPIDLGSWSPDFSIWGRRPSHPMLVEVKPLHSWDKDVARKMADACDDLGSRLLLVGESPEFGGEWDQIGWYGEVDFYEARWTEALLGVSRRGEFDLFPNDDSFCQESSLWEHSYSLTPVRSERLWVQAANHVQWRPKRGRGKA